ncbi:MAG: histidinol-phosphatase HisJ family protein [Candidatus Ornithomonoglobus sp.]
MYFADYHIHTHHSFDSEAEMEDICRNALSRGLNEIVVTDHLDIAEDKSFNDILDCEKWYAELLYVRKKYAGRLKIKLGIEIGTPQYNPKEYKAFYDKYPLDFIIGSVHNMRNNTDVGDHNFHKTDFRRVYEEYNALLMELARDYEYDVLGHLTYPSRYIEEQLGIVADVHTYTDFYIELFKVLKTRNKGIELNISGIARGGKTIMPPLWLIRLYRECGGEIITIGTDSHAAVQVGTALELAQSFLKEAGFSYYTVYTDHMPEMKPLP